MKIVISVKNGKFDIIYQNALTLRAVLSSISFTTETGKGVGQCPMLRLVIKFNTRTTTKVRDYMITQYHSVLCMYTSSTCVPTGLPIYAQMCIFHALKLKKKKNERERENKKTVYG